MADFLIYARESGANVEEQYQKGDVVEVFPDGTAAAHTASPTSGLRPPAFAWVTCAEVTLDQVRDRMEEWPRRLAFEVLARDVALDGWRIRVTNTTAASGGLGNLARDAVETFLTNWGAVVQSAAPNEVVFDFRAFAGATSPSFWRTGVAAVVFNELSYNETNGNHRIEANLAGTGITPAAVMQRAERRGATNVVQQSATAVRFTIQRDVVREAFQADVQASAQRSIRRRRFYISPADVDTILASGGTLVVTAAQLQSRIRDRRAE